MVQHTCGGDHDIGGVARSARGLEMPAAVLEQATGHLLSEVHEPKDVALARDALEIGVDLRAR